MPLPLSDRGSSTGKPNSSSYRQQSLQSRCKGQGSPRNSRPSLGTPSGANLRERIAAKIETWSRTLVTRRMRPTPTSRLVGTQVPRLLMVSVTVCSSRESLPSSPNVSITTSRGISSRVSLRWLFGRRSLTLDSAVCRESFGNGSYLHTHGVAAFPRKQRRREIRSTAGVAPFEWRKHGAPGSRRNTAAQYDRNSEVDAVGECLAVANVQLRPVESK
jgi:hypothetical protein